MDYTVVLKGSVGQKKVKVFDAACASDAESVAKSQNPEYDYVYDVFRGGGNVSSSTSRKELTE